MIKFLKKLSLYALIILSICSCFNNMVPDKQKIKGSVTIQKPIKIGMSAAFVSTRGMGVYQKIAGFLSKKLKRPIEFIGKMDYESINSSVKSGRFDLAFICGYPYILLKEENKKISLLVGPVINSTRYQNKPIYFSDLIVKRISEINSIKDLKGKIWAYNEELSNSGYNLPRAFMIQNNLNNGYFGKIIRSGAHENSIDYVRNGTADFSFVDSLILDYELVHDLKLRNEIKIIKSLRPTGVPPLVAASHVNEKLKNKIIQILSTMHLDREGLKILKLGNLKRFDKLKDSDYDSIRKAYKVATDKDILFIK